MKDFFYSIWTSLIFLIIMIYLTIKLWSIPMIILYVLFYVFYFDKARDWRKFRKDQKLKL